MKIDEIHVGDRLYTRISGDMVLVEIRRIVEREVGAWGSGKYQRHLVVARLDTGRELPKPRKPAALHKNERPGYHGSATVLGPCPECERSNGPHYRGACYH